MKTHFLVAPVLVLGSFIPFLSFAQVVPAPSVPAAPVKKTCADLKLVEVLVDGQKVMRYNIDDGALLSCLPAQPKVTWNVKKDSWTAQDEENWERFVTSIGRARQSGKCSTVDTCLVSSANPYRDDFDLKATHFSDCADFPMYLRAYFAFKNNLPFSFATGIKSNLPTAAQIEEQDKLVEKAQAAYDEAVNQYLPIEEQDKLKAALDKAIAYRQDFIEGKQTPQKSDNGNYATARYSVVGGSKDFFSVVRAINNQVSSGNYRMMLTPAGSQLSDFYPTKISRDALRTGTTVYSPNGHVGMIYEVRDDGAIMIMDAGINSDVKVYSFKQSDYPISRPQHAGQFKRWRPQAVENAKYDAAGNIVGGKMVLTPDSLLPNFSLEQYFGNVDPNNSNHRNAQWIVNGKKLKLFDYYEEKLATAAFDPVDRISQRTKDLCDLIVSRASVINTITERGINQKAHPSTLPDNVYSTVGEWETYAINSKDVNIRAGALAIVDSAKDYLGKQINRDPRLQYSGSNLKRDMLKAFIEASSSCKVTYKNGKGQSVTLSMGMALKRLTKMSATPYFCSERMWGASANSEIASCRDDMTKTEWYKVTQFLRNATNKDINGWGGASLDELRQMAAGGKLDMRDRSAEFDILKKLNEL